MYGIERRDADRGKHVSDIDVGGHAHDRHRGGRACAEPVLARHRPDEVGSSAYGRSLSSARASASELGSSPDACAPPCDLHNRGSPRRLRLFTGSPVPYGVLGARSSRLPTRPVDEDAIGGGPVAQQPRYGDRSRIAAPQREKESAAGWPTASVDHGLSFEDGRGPVQTHVRPPARLPAPVQGGRSSSRSCSPSSRRRRSSRPRS